MEKNQDFRNSPTFFLCFSILAAIRDPPPEPVSFGNSKAHRIRFTGQWIDLDKIVYASKKNGENDKFW